MQLSTEKPERRKSRPSYKNLSADNMYQKHLISSRKCRKFLDWLITGWSINLFMCYNSLTRAWAAPFLRFLDQTRSDICTQLGSSERESSLSQRTRQHNTQQIQEMNIHALDGIWTHHPRNQVASGLCLGPHSHWDEHFINWLQFIWQFCPLLRLYNRN